MNKIQTNEGWWVIENDSHLGKWIIESGKLDHDEFLIPIACDNIPVGGVAIDCGAMYGDHTIAYARKVGKEGAVIAIEAGKAVFECLMKNAEKFEGSVLLINSALCDVDGREAYHQVDEGNVGMSIVTSEKGDKIFTMTIDALVKESKLERLDFIKIDVEGWEYKTLLGSVKAINRFKPKMMIEMNSWTLAQQGTCYKDIYDLLLSLEYEWRILQPQCTGGDPQYDIACWHKDSILSTDAKT